MRYKVGSEEYATIEHALARAEQEAATFGEVCEVKVYQFCVLNVIGDDRRALDDLMSRSFYGCIDPLEQQYTINTMAANELLWIHDHTVFVRPDGTRYECDELPF